MKYTHATTIPSSSSPPYNSPPRKARLSPFVYVLLVFMLFFVVLYSEDFACLFDQVPLQSSLLSSPSRKIDDVRKVKTNFPFMIGRTTEGCDLFSGRWVRDESSRPMYEESECPYIPPQLTCQEHGRPEKDYQYWRWQPYGCSLPRFNATLMLETLRGKRMMFVGDSLNRGQFISLVCLLHSIIPQSSKSMETRGSLTIFTIKDYNATIEFYWAPFLLESNSDNAIVHRISDRIVRKGSINTHGKHWKGARHNCVQYLSMVDDRVEDESAVMLFLQSGISFDDIVQGIILAWRWQSFFFSRKGSFDDEVKDVMEVPTEGAYGMGLKSMLKWVRRNMNLNNSRVFFVTMSPSHQKSVDWGAEPGGNFYNQTTMIDDPSYWGSDCRKNVMRVLTKVFSQTTVPITVLSITQLSSYRRDAHTSIYKKQWNTLTPEQLANPASYADCVHWCLPGLQDVWNELLFTRLFYP